MNDPYEAINRLHDEAEELAERAKHTDDASVKRRLLDAATERIRKAAALRENIEESW